MGAYGDPIRVAVARELLPDLSSAGILALMEEALIIAEQSRVDAVTRRNGLKRLWLVREYRAGRRYDNEEGQRAAEAYANVLLARKAYDEMRNGLHEQGERNSK